MKRLIVMLLVMLLLAQPALAETDDSLLRRPWGITAEQMLEAEKAEGLERTYAFKTMYVFEDIPFFGETATLICRAFRRSSSAGVRNALWPLRFR